MTRTALFILLAVSLALSACERQQESPATPQQSAQQPPATAQEGAPAEIPRQTTPTPVAPTPEGSPAAAADPAQLQFPPRQEVDLQVGEKVYQSSCASCHDKGVAGATAQGNKQQWAPLLAKGYDTLVVNSIRGFKGPAGVMPPRGGNPDLSNAEVAAAVAYMMQTNE